MRADSKDALSEDTSKKDKKDYSHLTIDHGLANM